MLCGNNNHSDDSVEYRIRGGNIFVYQANQGTAKEGYLHKLQSYLDYPNSRCKENAGSKYILWPRDRIVHAQYTYIA